LIASAGQLHDYAQLKECVQLVSFKPFQRAEDSLQNINDVSEGVLSDALKDFIELNVPRQPGVALAVSDDKLVRFFLSFFVFSPDFLTFFSISTH
jgi:nucleolar protein 56